jgi:hypothetical protein
MKNQSSEANVNFWIARDMDGECWAFTCEPSFDGERFDVDYNKPAFSFPRDMWDVVNLKNGQKVHVSGQAVAEPHKLKISKTALLEFTKKAVKAELMNSTDAEIYDSIIKDRIEVVD